MIIHNKDNTSSFRNHNKEEGYIYVASSELFTIFKNCTTKNIRGFITDAVQSCVGILFVGNKAASLFILTLEMEVVKVLKKIKEINNREKPQSVHIIYYGLYGNDKSVLNFLRQFLVQIDENIRSGIKLIKIPYNDNANIHNENDMKGTQPAYFSVCRTSFWKDPNINFLSRPEALIISDEHRKSVELSKKYL